MSADAPMEEAAPPTVPVKRRRAHWQAALLGLITLVIAALAGALWWIDTDSGHRFLASRIDAMRPASGLRIGVGRIEGSIYKRLVLHDLALGDPQGQVAFVPVAYLDWYPVAWLSNRLDIDRLHVPRMALDRMPKLRPSGAKKPILPGFDIRLADLRIDRIDLGKAIAGEQRTALLKGRVDVRSGRAIIALDAQSRDAGDAIRLALDSRPDDNRFDLELLAVAPRGGVLAAMSGIGKSFVGRVTGKGDWTLWKGQALLSIDATPLSRIDIVQQQGRYALKGTVEAAALGTGLPSRLAAPRIALDAEGSMANRIVDGRLSLRSSALEVKAKGGIDLGRSGFDNLLLDIDMPRAGVLMKNASSDGLVARTRLNGPFATAAYEYLLTARRLTLGKTGIEGLRSAGKGRLALADTTVIPLDLRAASVVLHSPVLDDVLRDVSIRGLAQLKAGMLTSQPVAIRSNKIDGRVVLLADFRQGHYSAAFTGDVRGIEIQGLGRVDLNSKIGVISRAGTGFSVKGRARAIMRRLDNGFLRGLGGGLPQVVSDLTLERDGRVRFTGLTLTAPAIRLSAQGYRSTDGLFHFTGTGQHSSYGPLRLALDGKIDRPTVDLTLASPLPALGLKDVHALLVPDASGYAFTAEGGSRLGPFTGHGAILLPRGLFALIQIVEVKVDGATASGTLRPVTGGLDGTLALLGQAKGPIDFSMVDGVQQIGLDLSLDRARFSGPPAIAINRGTVKGTILLRLGATSLDIAAQGRGLRYGTARLGRFSATAKLVEGTGTVTASVAGQGGRLFDVQMRAGITPETIRIEANGSLDRAPVKLSRAAVLRAEDGGWRLEPAVLSYRGGSVRVGGLFGTTATHIDAAIAQMPLALLDLANDELGLGGVASGTVRYDAPRGGVPGGAAKIRVRGLTRSGLALSSAPIDIGINADLSGSRAAMRAVIAAGGKVTGRAQALMTPLGAGTLMQRLNAAPLRAQIRYVGDAGTLWRLSNIELFNLSGTATVNADVGGTLADPVIRGAVATDNATLQSPVTGMTLTNLATRGSFDGASLNFERLTARTRGGGTVGGTGRFTFSGERGIGIDIAATLTRAVILDRDDIGATASGPIRIRSEGDGGLISGEFNVVDSRFTLGRAAAIAEIPELRVVEVNRRGEEVEAQRPASPWRMAIKAHVPGRLHVTGLGMESEWSADLDIGGPVTAPTLVGEANLVRGDYDFAGKRFELREGRLRFLGETPINPQLNIRAQADVNDISATISVTGSSAKPIIGFTSIPALPQDELLSRILFGTSIAKISAPEALQLASAIAAFQGGGGGLDPINAVRRATGLSRLRILPADATTGAKTAVAAGKNIGRSVYVELITDGQGYSATRTEYQITRWLALIGAVSTIGRESVNLRATKDY
ncbi:translocation/assembly module TamB domain-containing protein [Sphingobium sufflavum]|uniref:translocation/assembly module TamB domain-containing protein n=1 Tax=Sphingobium sufflavum TaxID=1129547 RepID=UPI001F3892AF|nr:translocation/assembly module TamB domain-containing protein [Sphingobium sufflavum]MCE7796597.1 translocation/assembly module TamB domain-containing protein [Sphingobium sufflavum]